MEMLRSHASSVVSWTKAHRNLSVSIGLSLVVGSYVCFSAIPKALFYCGYDHCPKETRCNGSSMSSIMSNMANTCSTEDVSWKCNDITLRGLLLKPISSSAEQRLPCIIMAHGIGHIAAQGLIKYALQFCENGYVVLLFDYRSFGMSDGSPRHQASPSRHVQDWISAIHYMKNLHADIVDTSRMALWGTSFSGGHVLSVAGQVQGIRAVVSQVPFMAFQVPDEPLVVDTGKILRLLYGCIVTKIRSFLPFSSELYFRITASEANDGGKIALLDLDRVNETESQRRWVHDEWSERDLADWRNVISCRNVWEIIGYKPYEYIGALNENGTAVLYVCCQNDKICPLNRVEYAASITTKCEKYVVDDAVHYDAYQGEIRDNIIQKQLAFYNKHV